MHTIFVTIFEIHSPYADNLIGGHISRHLGFRTQILYVDEESYNLAHAIHPSATFSQREMKQTRYAIIATDRKECEVPPGTDVQIQVTETGFELIPVVEC